MNDSNNSALLTDLYELTMAQAYFRKEQVASATFSLFIRDYPPNRGYFVSAGLERVLSFLEHMAFEPSDLDYLRSIGIFEEDFLAYLQKMRFSGDVYAIPEGRLFFKDEPILEVTAPIIEAQLVESFIINAMNLQVTLATKVSRCVQAAKGRTVVDFAMRRAHGIEAAFHLARAGYIAGMSATSNVHAARAFDIPTTGTMAHSFITSFKSEREAFDAFAEIYGDATVLLIDTYDTLSGARKAVETAKIMSRRGNTLRGVRLDSGDMIALSREVRDILDRSGFFDTKIFASGGFDEYKIFDYLEAGAAIDGFGVGTKMGVSADAPYTDMAYKLVQYDGRPMLKLSSGKKTLVSEKQVYRNVAEGRLKGDLIALRSETRLPGEALLKPVMCGGKRLGPSAPLQEIRDRLSRELATLPDGYKQIRDPMPYPVDISESLTKRQEQTTHAVREKELGHIK